MVARSQQTSNSTHLLVSGHHFQAPTDKPLDTLYHHVLRLTSDPDQAVQDLGNVDR